MTDTVTLKPCPNPWCTSHGATDREIRAAQEPILIPSRGSDGWGVACPVCPLQTPWFDTEAEAITAWNTRDGGAATPMRENDKPPAHWTADDKCDRHPQTVEEWDWRADKPDATEFSIKRLNFAVDRGDPHAPDQMAIVLRVDLSRVLGRLTHYTAHREMLMAKDAAATPMREAASSVEYVEKPGRFADYSTESLAAQCRMQARENLDLEYSQFMTAVADRLLAIAHLESEARRFAGFYEPNSDMANTLNILGNKIAALALSATPAQEVDETEPLRPLRDIRAISADPGNKRILCLHFNRETDGGDREAILAAINAAPRGALAPEGDAR